MLSISELLNNKGVNRLDNKLLLQKVIGFSDVQLIIKDDYVLSNEQYNDYQILLQRLLDKEPVNYILGYKEFYSRNFKVNSYTLIPRPETELLVETVLSKLPYPSAKILELGTGSGCIAITLKLEQPILDITASDKYLETLNVAIENASTLKVDIQFIQSDWYQNISHNKFDIIVSNPPYIHKDDIHLDSLTYEPQHALTDGADGLAFIREIIASSINYLTENGWVILEHGYDQGLAVREIFIQHGFDNVKTLQDYAGVDRITLGKFCILPITTS